MKAARLVVLGIAVAAGGIAAYLASSSEPPPAPPAPAPVATIDVLVAAKDLGIGSSISEHDVQWQTWPATTANPTLVTKNERPNAIQDYAGSVVRVPMMLGEPVRDNKIIKAKGSGYLAAVLPSGMRAYSTEISAETGAGGFILPNDRVDVILSRRDREAEKATGVEAHVSNTILTNIRVLAIDQLVQEKEGQRVVVGKTATLELTQRQAETLAVARQTGTLSLTLRSIVDANAKDTPAADTRNDNRINMIRFGVSSSTVSK